MFFDGRHRRFSEQRIPAKFKKVVVYINGCKFEHLSEDRGDRQSIARILCRCVV